jgi:hypothetical protein
MADSERLGDGGMVVNVRRLGALMWSGCDQVTVLLSAMILEGRSSKGGGCSTHTEAWKDIRSLM